MWDRRHVLSSVAAVATLGVSEALAKTKKKATAKKSSTKAKAKPKAKPKPVAPPPPSVTSPENRALLNGTFTTIYNDIVRSSPMFATSLGLDKGDLAGLKSQVDDRSIGSKAVNLGRMKRAQSALMAIDRSKVFGMDRVNYDTVLWDLNASIEGAQQFSFGETGGATPYVLSQLSGMYQGFPDFMDNQHSIETKDDADAYISRLNGYAKALTQETERARDDYSKGMIPPDFIIGMALKQLASARDVPLSDQVLINSIARRTQEKNISGDWAAKATAIVSGPIATALNAQIEALTAILPKASHNAGIMHRPQGEAYYAWGAKLGTSTKMSPREIHELGLAKVAEISSEIDVRFKALGLTQGSAGERMHALYNDPAQIYPNTKEGKAELLANLNKKVEVIFSKLPDYFKTLPKSKVDIRAVPEAIEAGAPGGYYQGASLDGTRPGAYYINLRDTAGQPKWLLSTLTYHEAIPGHHMQISIQQEAQGLPDLRKISGFNAYIEGWALYSEQLAAEMGMYESDSYGRIGYLHDALFRAVRLVVDTGMHYLGWSREQAIAYMAEKMGDNVDDVTTEIERYCVWPGQALGYMVGKLSWLKIREASKAKLGSKFDIRSFHDTGLLCGAVPLDVLETVYKEASMI